MAQETAQTDLVVVEPDTTAIVMQADLVVVDLDGGGGPGPGPSGGRRRPVIVACGE